MPAQKIVAPHATAEGSALSRFRSTAKKVVNARKVTAGLYADAQKRAQIRAKTATEAALHRAESVTKLRGELQRRSSISSVKSATRRKYQATHGRRTAHHEAAIAPAAPGRTSTRRRKCSGCSLQHERAVVSWGVGGLCRHERWRGPPWHGVRRRAVVHAGSRATRAHWGVTLAYAHPAYAHAQSRAQAHVRDAVGEVRGLADCGEAARVCQT